MSKPGGVQPHAFNDKRKAEFLLELVKTGSIRGAAARTNVHHTTVYEHAREDEKFRESIERARGEFEQAALQAIWDAGTTGEVIERRNGSKTIKPGDWRALAWMLEHNPAYREQYAGILRQRVQIGPGEPDFNPQDTEGIVADIGPGTMDRLTSVVMVLVQNGVLRLPDPGEVINVTPDDENGTS